MCAISSTTLRVGQPKDRGTLSMLAGCSIHLDGGSEDGLLIAMCEPHWPYLYSPTEEEMKQEDDIVLVCELCGSENVPLAIECVQCNELPRFIDHPAMIQLNRK